MFSQWEFEILYQIAEAPNDKWIESPKGIRGTIHLRRQQFVRGRGQKLVKFADG